MCPEPPLELFQNVKLKRDVLAGARERGAKGAPEGAQTAPSAAMRHVAQRLWLATLKWPWALFARMAFLLALLAGFGFGWQHRATLHDRVTQWVAQTTGATVQKIEVSGMTYTTQPELLQALGLQRGSSLVGFDAQTARTRIEALPWVRLASVERQLPATVKIQIYEYVPLARVVDGAQVWVINPQGRRLVPDDANVFVALPLLQGTGADVAAGPLFAALADYTPLMNQLREAIYVGQRRWDLRFVSGVMVQLPEDNAAPGYSLAQALPRLMALEEARHVLTLNAGEVDLRLKDRIVLRLPETVGTTPVTNKTQATPTP